MKRILMAAAIAWAGLAGPAAADMIVEKRVFELPSYTTVAGRTIRNVRIGWESYGTLNADRSNAILVTHFFSGTKHAAGKYAASDRAAGYWDYLIGPGKPIDTDKYFVISSDTLVNLNVGDPNVTTTGPASIDPDTGKPYGMNFPLVAIRDFVEVQRALLDHLGIQRLHAVVGPSMGALQAYEWAASHPDRVARLLPVIGAAEADPWLIAWLDVWAAPIRLDPKWQGGDYYGREPPLEGLKQALKIVSLHANHWQWTGKTFGRAPAEEGRDPAAAFDHRYKVQQALDQAAAARAATADANHFLYLVKANQTFAAAGGAEGLKRIRARTLVLYAPTDQVFAAEWVKATAEAIRAGGAAVETAEIAGPNGHLNGVLGLAPLGGRIAAFLAE